MNLLETSDVGNQVAFEQKLLWLLLAGCLTVFTAASGWGFNVLLDTNKAVIEISKDVEFIKRRLDIMEKDNESE